MRACGSKKTVPFDNRQSVVSNQTYRANIGLVALKGVDCVSNTDRFLWTSTASSASKCLFELQSYVFNFFTGQVLRGSKPPVALYGDKNASVSPRCFLIHAARSNGGRQMSDERSYGLHLTWVRIARMTCGRTNFGQSRTAELPKVRQAIR